jgi:hypothetical protein
MAAKNPSSGTLLDPSNANKVPVDTESEVDWLLIKVNICRLLTKARVHVIFVYQNISVVSGMLRRSFS